jgi:hypothetical protein
MPIGEEKPAKIAIRTSKERKIAPAVAICGHAKPFSAAY